MSSVCNISGPSAWMRPAWRLLELGHVAVMPIRNHGETHDNRRVRLAFGSEPTERLADIGARVRRALT